MSDAYNFHRFLDAQEGVYDTILEELQAGRKSSHWIWLIFPQIAGLGHSGRSCMTLFLTAAPDNTLFNDALLKYFDGKPDTLTLDILAQQLS